jgi:SAM-dependent methyltransferase
MIHGLVRTYRTAEDFRRYSPLNAPRLRKFRMFYRANARFFGESVLDFGCGGGILATVLRGTGRRYVGVDANPDMIRLARRTASASGENTRFVLGDIRRVKLRGTFTTWALLGNTMGHLSTADLGELVDLHRANAQPKTTFLIDYRDLVGMFWRGTWRRVRVQKFVRGKVVHRTTRVNLEEGMLEMLAVSAARRWKLKWNHAIWSPFILESLMRSHGWRLVHRSAWRSRGRPAALPEGYTDVYRHLR